MSVYAVERRSAGQRPPAVPLLVAGLAEGGGEPLETLVQTISGGSAGGLNVLLDEKGLVSICAKLGIPQRAAIQGHGTLAPGLRVKEHTQARCLKLWRPSLSVISAAFMAFCESMSARLRG